MLKLLCILLMVLSSALYALPATYYVDASRPDDTGAGTNWVTAKKTIQAGVNLATNGQSTVFVSNGTYTVTAQIVVTRGITIRSINGPETTIISAYKCRCINLGGSFCTLSGFTIKNGYNYIDPFDVSDPKGFGGGVFCENTNPIITNCIINANYAHSGAGVYRGTVSDCVVRNNQTHFSKGFMGGGLYESIANNCTITNNYSSLAGGGLSESTANNCLIAENQGRSMGGGMYNGTANNCTFVNNKAGDGGGMRGGVANNCTVMGNHASFGGGGLAQLLANNCLVTYNSSSGGGGGGNILTANNCTICYNSAANHGGGLYQSDAYNCIVWGNTAGASSLDSEITTFHFTCCPATSNGVAGNITNAPFFVDEINTNFHLRAGSPCINAGHNSYVSTSNDLAGNGRIAGAVIDMGAYECPDAGPDVDSDGMDDLWEMKYFQSRHFADPSVTCSNGVNTLLAAYVAGFDPNNSDSTFQIAALRFKNSGNVLQWQGVSGRVYSVLWTTNLLVGFQPLNTNIPWAAGSYTDVVHTAEGQIFYKINVRLEN